MQIVSDGPGTHHKKAPLVRISQPQADGWGVRRSLRERTHAHADEISYFVPSPLSYFLYPANSNLSYFIETNPAAFLSLSLFPLREM